eukprot:5797301-Pyramimonas_sp.AAC.1
MAASASAGGVVCTGPRGRVKESSSLSLCLPPHLAQPRCLRRCAAWTSRGPSPSSGCALGSSWRPPGSSSTGLAGLRLSPRGSSCPTTS